MTPPDKSLEGQARFSIEKNSIRNHGEYYSVENS